MAKILEEIVRPEDLYVGEFLLEQSKSPGLGQGFASLRV
jgi:hypothetical protein